jgi:putative ABC transport system substrate-binding protein
MKLAGIAFATSVMRRREFIALAGASVTWPCAATAQQAGRTYRLSCLRAAPRYSPFFDELRRQGFIEGQNLTVEYRAYAQHLDLIPQFAAELVKAQVDVIVATGGETVRVLQQTTKTIPIVAAVADMAGLVTSLARPEGNTTGVSALLNELDGKRQEILIEAMPGLRLMAVLADVNYPNAAPAQLDALHKAARAHSVELSVHRVARGEEIAAAIDSAQASGATALNVLSSPLFYAHRHLIMERAVVAHLPAIYDLPELAEQGGFAAYGPRQSTVEEKLARQVVQLFRGSKVADIPVEQPTKFELVINLKTAKAMGITVPEALLVRADKVIE